MQAQKEGEAHGAGTVAISLFAGCQSRNESIGWQRKLASQRGVGVGRAKLVTPGLLTTGASLSLTKILEFDLGPSCYYLGMYTPPAPLAEEAPKLDWVSRVSAQVMLLTNLREIAFGMDAC